MKRTDAMSKVFSEVSAGRQPSAAGKADTERMVSCGWLTRDRDGTYSTTPKGRKAFAANQEQP